GPVLGRLPGAGVRTDLAVGAPRARARGHGRVVPRLRGRGEPSTRAAAARRRGGAAPPRGGGHDGRPGVRRGLPGVLCAPCLPPRPVAGRARRGVRVDRARPDRLPHDERPERVPRRRLDQGLAGEGPSGLDRGADARRVGPLRRGDAGTPGDVGKRHPGLRGCALRGVVAHAAPRGARALHAGRRRLARAPRLRDVEGPKRPLHAVSCVRYDCVSQKKKAFEPLPPLQLSEFGFGSAIGPTSSELSPSRRSSPLPPLSVSLPKLPTTRSLPFSPLTVSLPGPPKSSSSPVPPVIVSVPSMPAAKSLPLPPSIVSLPSGTFEPGFPGSPLKSPPTRPSSPLPPEIVSLPRKPTMKSSPFPPSMVSPPSAVAPSGAPQIRSLPSRPSIVSAPVVPTITSSPFVPTIGPVPLPTIVAGVPWHVGVSSAETGETATASAHNDAAPRSAMNALKKNLPVVVAARASKGNEATPS